MKVQVLRGTRDEIAETVLRIGGEVREAIVFFEEPSGPSEDPSGDDIFAEMQPFTVMVGGADYSREAIYSRLDGE
jgi:hypothetical protein